MNSLSLGDLSFNYYVLSKSYYVLSSTAGGWSKCRSILKCHWWTLNNAFKNPDHNCLTFKKHQLLHRNSESNFFPEITLATVDLFWRCKCRGAPNKKDSILWIHSIHLIPLVSSLRLLWEAALIPEQVPKCRNVWYDRGKTVSAHFRNRFLGALIWFSTRLHICITVTAPFCELL